MGMGDNSVTRASDAAILGLITQRLRGVQDPLAQQTLLRSATDFLRWSCVWRETLTLGDLADLAYVFDLENSEFTRCRVQDVLWVKIDDTEIPRTRYGDPSWQVSQPATAEEPQQLTLLDPYNTLVDGDVTARVVWVPMPMAPDFPDWVLNQYLNVVVELTVARLLQMPGNQWSNIPLGRQAEIDAKLSICAVRSEVVAAENQEVVP